MDKAINRAIDNYLQILRDKYSDIETAYLFGSYAKNNYNPDSDIDLALIFKNLDDTQRFDLQVQLMMIASKIDTRIEPHPISHDEFNSSNPFVIEIQRTGVEIKS